MSEFNRLRVMRAERRMTQLTLAIVTRIHPTRVWKIENGYVVPEPRERRAIASSLGVSERDIWPISEAKEPTRSESVSDSQKGA